MSDGVSCRGGKLRTEDKIYIVQPGDVVGFKSNVSKEANKNAIANYAIVCYYMNMSKETPDTPDLLQLPPAIVDQAHQMTQDIHAEWAADRLAHEDGAQAYLVGFDAYSTAVAAKAALKKPSERTPHEAAFLRNYYEFAQASGNVIARDTAENAKALDGLSRASQDMEFSRQVRVATDDAKGSYEDMEGRVKNALHERAIQDDIKRDINRSYDQAHQEHEVWRANRSTVRKAVGKVATLPLVRKTLPKTSSRWS